MKRETAPSSESTQYILAWRSKDIIESAVGDQGEAQPGNGSDAIPGVAQGGGSKSPARGQSLKQVETMRGGRWRGWRVKGERWGDWVRQ